MTDEYAANLDGSVFACEGGSGYNDDSANMDDDDAAPTPAPSSDAPTPAPDDVLPIDDDGDPNHDANEAYEKKLLHCMSLDDCSSDDSCTFCTFNGGAMCFSKQAARQMDGSYYTCPDIASVTTMNANFMKEEDALIASIAME